VDPRTRSRIVTSVLVLLILVVVVGGVLHRLP